jgi:hypothetical protein
MIADVVNFAIAGLGFCHAVSRLMLHKGFIAAMNIVVTRNRDHRRELDVERRFLELCSEER